MHSLSKITGNLFKTRPSVEQGLYPSLEELMEQRKNLSFLRKNNKFRSSDMAGEVRSAFKGRGIEMEEIRAYNFGDDVRDIDWRVTARKQSPYTKIYAEEKDREIYVLLDFSPSMIFGTKKELKSVTAGKIAALIGWLAQENKDRFGLVVFDGYKTQTIKSQHNRSHLLAILKKISSAGEKAVLNIENSDNQENMASSLQLLTKMIKNQATVFILSDFVFFDDQTKASLAALSKKTQIFCITINDVLEIKAPAKGEYMVENKGETLVFDSRPQDFRTEYREYFSAKRMLLKDFCQKFNCRYISLRTDKDILRQLKFI